MAATKNTCYRLPATIKSKLRTLAAMDDTTGTETLKRLINAEYRARRDEIKEFRESAKIEENMRELKKIKD